MSENAVETKKVNETRVLYYACKASEKNDEIMVVFPRDDRYVKDWIAKSCVKSDGTLELSGVTARREKTVKVPITVDGHPYTNLNDLFNHMISKGWKQATIVKKDKGVDPEILKLEI